VLDLGLEVRDGVCEFGYGKWPFGRDHGQDVLLQCLQLSTRILDCAEPGAHQQIAPLPLYARRVTLGIGLGKERQRIAWHDVQCPTHTEPTCQCALVIKGILKCLALEIERSCPEREKGGSRRGGMEGYDIPNNSHHIPLARVRGEMLPVGQICVDERARREPSHVTSCPGPRAVPSTLRWLTPVSQTGRGLCDG
jgi:hypothetical protein